MKQILFACLGIFLFASCKPNKDVPVKVKIAFETKYPLAKEIEWDKEDTEYEVEFEVEGMEMSSTFSETGEWLETEMEININDIPETIQKAIQLKYTGYTIDDAEVVENPDMKGYELALEKDKKEIEVVFNNDGTFLKEKVKEDDDMDNKKK